MAVTLTLTGKTPGQTQFGLDTFTEHYKCDVTADVVLTDGSVPAMGSVHPSYPFMFVTARYCSETSESASALDLTYMGVLGGTCVITLNDPGADYVAGDQVAIASGSEIAGIVVDSVGGGGEIATFHVSFNNFTTSHTALAAVNIAGSGLGSGATFDVTATAFALPPQQHISTQAVMSGTSSRGFDGTILTSPLSAQYYAPANKLQWITYGAPGAAGTASNPTSDIVPITVTLGDTTYSPTGVLATVINNFFTRLVVGALDTTEIVAGKFWQNGETRTLTLSPLIVSVAPGDYIIMYAPGSGYIVGNTLVINDGMGHSCSINVDSIGIGGSVVGFTPSSNTFDYTTPSPLSASGGSGSGAGFYNYHIA